MNIHWRIYERIVAAMEAEFAGIDFSVTPNARLVGDISGKSRQVDVLIDARWGDDLSGRVIVDAKHRKRPIDIREVESLEGMMKDCRANRGVIVCTSGYTDGASKRAQKCITIKLLTAEEAEEFDWSAVEPCIGDCIDSLRPRNHGLVLWDGQLPITVGSEWAIIFTGKCDICHDFHVWCWDCGEKFGLSVEDEHECGCGRTWISAIEDETEGVNEGQSKAVHLLMMDGADVVPLDRRALR